jgi:hypothetical protein
MGDQSKIQWTDSTFTPKTGRPGPAPNPPRDGDKAQARASVALAVKNGQLKKPNTLPCYDCGHVWMPGERRHEYDHFRGYGAEDHLNVQVVCTKCHSRRDDPRATKTHCIRGHEFTVENTLIVKNGTRHCRECRRLYDRNRKRPPGYWKAVNERRRLRHG